MKNPTSSGFSASDHEIMRKMNEERALQAKEEAKLKDEAYKAAGPGPTMTVKGFKSCKGDEGPAFSGELYVDGEHAAHVRDDGNGGPLWIEWVKATGKGAASFRSGPHFEKLAAYAAKIPAYPFCGTPMTTDVELLVGTVFEDHAAVTGERAQIAKKLAREVWFKGPGMGAGEWGKIAGLFTVTMRARLVREVGPTIRFAHEMFLDAKPLDLPADAESLIPHALKGNAALKSTASGGKWIGFKVKADDVGRARLAKLHPDAIYLSDLIAEAQHDAKKSAPRSRKAA